MRKAIALVLAVTAMLAASIAAAAPAGNAVARADHEGLSVAAGVNLPFRWKGAKSVAGSLQVGFRRHHAIRGTFASNPYAHNIAASLIELAGTFEAEGSLMTGRVLEFGVAYQYFAGSLFRGPLLEGGVFRRHVDGVEDYRFHAPEYIATDTVGYGARGLIGWSWRFWGDHVFFATAFGLGMARHTGTEATKVINTDEEMRVSSVTRYQASAEFYLRFGGAFDL